MLITEKVVLTIQILCYLTGIMLVFANPVYFFEIIMRFCFMLLALILKIAREIKNQNTIQLFKNQLNFCIAYILVALEIVFLYNVMEQVFDTSLIAWSLMIIIVQNMNYSLLMH